MMVREVARKSNKNKIMLVVAANMMTMIIGYMLVSLATRMLGNYSFTGELKNVIYIPDLITAAVFTFLAYGGVIVCNILLYKKVLQTERMNRKWVAVPVRLQLIVFSLMICTFIYDKHIISWLISMKLS